MSRFIMSFYIIFRKEDTSARPEYEDPTTSTSDSPLIPRKDALHQARRGAYCILCFRLRARHSLRTKDTSSGKERRFLHSAL